MRAPHPMDRWIDPDIVTIAEADHREVARLRAELAARRDAAIAEFGPLDTDPNTVRAD